MSEMIDAVNENANQAREREQVQAAWAEELSKAEAVQRAQRRLRRRKKATHGIIVRAVAVVIVCVGLWLARFYGLMDVLLTTPLTCAAFVWLAFWVGAWVQFMWARGGLLDVCAE